MVKATHTTLVTFQDKPTTVTFIKHTNLDNVTTVHVKAVEGYDTFRDMSIAQRTEIKRLTIEAVNKTQP